MQPPTLTDGRVTLRALGPGDVEPVLAHATDPETARWARPPQPFGRGEAEHLVAVTARRGWEHGGPLLLAVEAGGRGAGTVALHPDGAGAADVRYGLAPWARGEGVASAAVRLLLAWAAGPLGLAAVHWRAQVGDWAARRVAWASGFLVEGRVRALLAHGDERRDAWVGSWRAGDPTRARSSWREAPELLGAGVLLRAGHAGDAARIAEACAAPSTQQWLPQLPSPYTIADALAYLHSRQEAHADGTGVFWTVASAEQDLALGQIGLMGLTDTATGGEIGYWVHPDARRRGVATAAVRAVARHALLDPEDGGLGLQRVLVKVADGNTGSRAVAQAAGFTAVGRDRRAEVLRDGRRVDFLRYDLLAAELADSLAHPSAWR